MLHHTTQITDFTKIHRHASEVVPAAPAASRGDRPAAKKKTPAAKSAPKIEPEVKTE
jgi:hypothetical protein